MAFVTPDSAEGVRVQLSACLRLVRQYEWLIDCYVLDFFVEDHWSRIPSEWRDTLASLSWEQIQSWLNPASHTVKSQSPFPLSLLALKSSVKALSLTRSPVPNLDPIREFFSVSPNGSTWPPPAFGSDMSRSVYNIFRKHIKEKKQHEIVRMVQLTDLLAAKSGGCHQVVDIGSGVGHLSRLLSYDRGFRVTCVDTEKDFSASAKNIDADLNREMVHRVDPAHSRAAPTHLTYRIEPNTSAEDFQVSLGPHLEASPQYGLLGLHTCGDLGPCLIRLFVESKDAVFLQSVGCCYMKLETMFPMSAFLSRHDALPPSSFSYIAKELSCHAMETYCQRLTVKEQNSKLKVHCYRAMLEKILAERFPDFRHSVLKTVKNAHLLEFEDYARRATLNHTDIIWESDFFKSDYVLMGLNEWNRVAAFYSLRLAFAPVLETIFLLDRALYLLEKGISSVVAPIFDPAISPRNHVIMAVKPTDLVIQ